MDQQKLRSLVFEKTGVKVDSDDPIFALVALNQAVLADTVERQVALLKAAAQELALQARTGGAPMPALPVAAPDATAPDARTPRTPRSGAARDWRLLGAAAGVSLLSAALTLAGQALLLKPAPNPAPAPAAATAPALTAEQAAAIAQGEKLARAVQKLDPKSRALIQAELQKNPP